MKAFAQTRLNSQVIAAHDDDRSGRALPGMPFFALLSRLERSSGLSWPRLEASSRIRKADGRRPDGGREALVDAADGARGGVVFEGAHEAVGPADGGGVGAPAIAFGWMRVKAGGPRLHQSSRQPRLVAVRIIPPDEGVYEPARWVGA